MGHEEVKEGGGYPFKLALLTAAFPWSFLLTLVKSIQFLNFFEHWLSICVWPLLCLIVNVHDGIKVPSMTRKNHFFPAALHSLVPTRYRVRRKTSRNVEDFVESCHSSANRSSTMVYKFYFLIYGQLLPWPCLLKHNAQEQIHNFFFHRRS